MMVCSVLIWYLQNRDNIPISVFYGKENYGDLKTNFFYGSFLRLEAIVIGLLMTFGLLFVIPACKTFLSYIGQHSLRVYIFHLPFVILLMDTNFLQKIRIDGTVDFIGLMVISVIIVAVLSIPIFEYPFKWINMLVNKLYKVEK